MGDVAHFPRIIMWVREYGSAGHEDKRAIDEFMTVETHEAIRGLQSELIAVSNGNFVPDTMDKMVGLKRKQKHGTYNEWAKSMLLWMSAFKP